LADKAHTILRFARLKGKGISMLEVHPSHKSIHGWRDFLLHLLTITIGLLIALSLEGCVEWEHRRHLVHEAERSLQVEIETNARGLKETAADILNQRKILRADVDVLKQIIKDHKAPKDSHMEITFHIRGFANLSWKTAQSTGALSYMSYANAKEFAEIYNTQERIELAQDQAARDAILSLAPFINLDDKDGDPDPADAISIRRNIEILQGQLILLDSLVASLDGEYKKFLAAHSDG
jgi:hypothetical protein